MPQIKMLQSTAFHLPLAFQTGAQSTECSLVGLPHVYQSHESKVKVPYVLPGLEPKTLQLTCDQL